MDHKKRSISEEDKGSGLVKRQKTSETVHDKEISNLINLNVETPAFQSDTSTTDSEPESTKADNVCDKSLINLKEELKDGLSIINKIEVSSSSAIIVAQGDPGCSMGFQFSQALGNKNQTLPCLNTIKSKVEEENESCDQHQPTNSLNIVLSKQSEYVSNAEGTDIKTHHDLYSQCGNKESETGSVVLFDDTDRFVESERIKETSNEEVIHDNTMIPKEDVKQERLKDICSKELIHDSTNISMNVGSETLQKICPEAVIDDSTMIQVVDFESKGLKKNTSEIITILVEGIVPENLQASNNKEVIHGSTNTPAEGVELESLKENFSEGVTEGSSTILVEHAGPDCPKKITSNDIINDSSMITMDDAESERLMEINSKDVTKDKLLTPTEGEKVKEVISKGTMAPSVEDIGPELIKDACSENVIHISTEVPVEDAGPKRPKKTISVEVTCDSTELPVVEVKQDKLERDIDEKRNDTVSSPLNFEILTDEEIKLEQKNEKTTSITYSPVENAEIAQQTTLSDESTKNESQKTEPENKPYYINRYPYRYLYRLLRSDEDPCKEGIKAKAPDSWVSVEDHVRIGSKGISSKYISTSSTLEAARDLRSICRKTCNPKIAKIDCKGLACVEYIDLTEDDIRDKHLSSTKSKLYADRYDEVLVIGYIPASHCKIV